MTFRTIEELNVWCGVVEVLLEKEDLPNSAMNSADTIIEGMRERMPTEPQTPTLVGEVEVEDS